MWEFVPTVQKCEAPAWAQAAFGQPEVPTPEPWELCTAASWAQSEYVRTRNAPPLP